MKDFLNFISVIVFIIGCLLFLGGLGEYLTDDRLSRREKKEIINLLQGGIFLLGISVSYWYRTRIKKFITSVLQNEDIGVSSNIKLVLILAVLIGYFATTWKAKTIVYLFIFYMWVKDKNNRNRVNELIFFSVCIVASMHVIKPLLRHLKRLLDI